MKKFNQEEMKNLLFENFNIEKMEFSREKKELKIFIKKGVLFFNDWESIWIKSSDSKIVEGLPEGQFNKLCEVIFSDPIVYLGGNDSEGYVEWIIMRPKMHAEFDDYVEDLDWKPKTSR